MELNTIIRRISSELFRYKDGRETIEQDAREKLAQLQDLLPSGSGFDAGTQIDLDKSTPEKIVLNTAFHHMNDGGYYDGWTEHTVTVRPSFLWDFDIRVGGRDRNCIKEYIAEMMHQALTQPAGI